ncbi:MAG: acyl-CoA synthetase FdrA, partial [Hyphomicrobiales bacterium]
MTGVVINEVRRGFYLDSVALMRLSRTVAQMDGVEQAALMVGTPANIEIMADAGLLDATGRAAAGGDLIIAIMAASPEAGQAALTEAMRLIDQPAGARDGSQAWRPRTLRAAVRSMSGSNLALISVPGAFAAGEARKALRHDLHVMLFSDNVSLEDEVALKHEAHERGLLLMGPDCGTAIINGVPLAF